MKVKKVIFLTLLITTSVLCTTYVLAQQDEKNYIVKLKQNDNITLFSDDLEKYLIPKTFI